jgi:hypothetical protein
MAENFAAEAIQPLTVSTLALSSTKCLRPGRYRGCGWLLPAISFGDATLQELPADSPRLVINATSVQSGALWRSMRPYMREHKVGEVCAPNIGLTTAVSASSACPPSLSPLRLKLDPSLFSGCRVPGRESLTRFVLGHLDRGSRGTLWPVTAH